MSRRITTNTSAALRVRAVTSVVGDLDLDAMLAEVEAEASAQCRAELDRLRAVERAALIYREKHQDDCLCEGCRVLRAALGDRAAEEGRPVQRNEPLRRIFREHPASRPVEEGR